MQVVCLCSAANSQHGTKTQCSEQTMLHLLEVRLTFTFLLAGALPEEPAANVPAPGAPPNAPLNDGAMPAGACPKAGAGAG